MTTIDAQSGVFQYDSVRVHRVLTEARRYAAAGLSVVPVPLDGSKHPTILWRRYRSRWPSDRQLVVWFGAGHAGPAILCGRVSGWLEVFDVDDADVFVPWQALVEARLPGLFARLPVVRSPRPGYHVYLRCPLLVAGNQKLAQAPGPDGRLVTLIETRGEGGLVLSPACPAACHPAGRPYVLVQGQLTRIPEVTPAQRAVLLDSARSLSRHVAPARVVAGHASPQWEVHGSAGAAIRRVRPGDSFNAVASWPNILEPHGWICVGGTGEAGLWRRPGKAGTGWSATTDYAGSGLLYVFSSNAAPFEPGHIYTKFAAHTLLDFEGDFRAAARHLSSDTTGRGRRRLQRAAPEPQQSGFVAARPDRSDMRRLTPVTRSEGVLLPPLARPSGVTLATLLRPDGLSLQAHQTGRGGRR